MKKTVKEILKNKSDKIVDLIIDEIGTEGQKEITTSFVDEKRGRVKYILKIDIQSGSEDSIVPEQTSDIEIDILKDQIRRLNTDVQLLKAEVFKPQSESENVDDPVDDEL